jgi:hypothetical protein
MGKVKILHYVRCPLCGKNSQKKNIARGSSTGHALETLTQECAGKGKGGFRWLRWPKDEDQGWIRFLMQALKAVYGRLADRLRALGEEPEPLEEPRIVKPIILDRPRIVDRPNIIDRPKIL